MLTHFLHITRPSPYLIFAFLFQYHQESLSSLKAMPLTFLMLDSTTSLYFIVLRDEIPHYFTCCTSISIMHKWNHVLLCVLVCLPLGQYLINTASVETQCIDMIHRNPPTSTYIPYSLLLNSLIELAKDKGPWQKQCLGATSFFNFLSAPKGSRERQPVAFVDLRFA